MTRRQAQEDILFCSMHTPDQRDKLLEGTVNKIYDNHETQINSLELKIRAKEQIIDKNIFDIREKDKIIERLKAENKKYIDHIALKHLKEPIIFCAACSKKISIPKETT